eukprot:scaffold69367_cov90-Cyclotella_meneghiniana.AAC.3
MALRKRQGMSGGRATGATARGRPGHDRIKIRCTISSMGAREQGSNGATGHGRIKNSMHHSFLSSTVAGEKGALWPSRQYKFDAP